MTKGTAWPSRASASRDGEILWRASCAERPAIARPARIRVRMSLIMLVLTLTRTDLCRESGAKLGCFCGPAAGVSFGRKLSLRPTFARAYNVAVLSMLDRLRESIGRKLSLRLD